MRRDILKHMSIVWRFGKVRLVVLPIALNSNLLRPESVKVRLFWSSTYLLDFDSITHVSEVLWGWVLWRLAASHLPLSQEKLYWSSPPVNLINRDRPHHDHQLLQRYGWGRLGRTVRIFAVIALARSIAISARWIPKWRLWVGACYWLAKDNGMK